MVVVVQADGFSKKGRAAFGDLTNQSQAPGKPLSDKVLIDASLLILRAVSLTAVVPSTSVVAPEQINKQVQLLQQLELTTMLALHAFHLHTLHAPVTFMWSDAGCASCLKGFCSSQTRVFTL